MQSSDLLDFSNLGISNFSPALNEFKLELNSQGDLQTGITKGLGSQVVVPSLLGNAQEEYKIIISEYGLGNMVRENALFRIWRIKRMNLWKDIVSSDGKFFCWEDFVTHICNTLSISRQSIFSRVRVYDCLAYFQFTETEMVKMMMESPSLYNNAMTKIVLWDTQKQRVVRYLLPEIIAADNDQARIEIVRNLIKGLSVFDRQADALSYLEHVKNTKPEVKVYLDSDVIVVEYTTYSMDMTTNKTVIEDYGRIEFTPNEYVPEWVLNKLKRRL